jgi:SARP family transcriptional regulator, regulator of embCAB operon
MCFLNVVLGALDDIILALAPDHIAAVAGDRVGHLGLLLSVRCKPILARHEDPRGHWDYIGALVGAAEKGTRIQLCGQFVVRVEGRRIERELPGRQGRLLFACLVLNRDRPATRDELVDAIWPGGLPADPQAAVNPLISKLRRLLPEGWLTGRHELRLRLAAGAIVDIESAAEAVHRAEALLAAERWADACGPSLLAQNVTERPLLPGEDAPWLEDARRDLVELRHRAMEAAVRAALGTGGMEPRWKLPVAKRLVKEAPYRESGHRLLMELLAAEGNVAEALRAYEELRRLLREELGTAPSRATQAVHARLLAMDG